MTDSEARARLAAWYVKELLSGARDYWMDLETNLSVEEQAMFWQFFDSKERTFLLNRATGTTKPAKEKL